MLKRKTFLKKKASRDISASRNLRLRRLKHRKAQTIPTPRITISDSRHLKKGEHYVRPFIHSLFFIFQKNLSNVRLLDEIHLYVEVCLIGVLIFLQLH